MKRNWIVNAMLAIGGFCAGTVLMDCVGPNAEDMEVAQYCDLVALHNSDPDLGWPDFRQRFDKDCNADGTVKEQGNGNP